MTYIADVRAQHRSVVLDLRLSDNVRQLVLVVLQLVAVHLHNNARRTYNIESQNFKKGKSQQQWCTELSQEVAITMVVRACSDPLTDSDEISEGGLGNL